MKNKANTHKPKKHENATQEDGSPRKFADNHEKKANKYGVVPVLMEEEIEEHEGEFEQEC